MIFPVLCTIKKVVDQRNALHQSEPVELWFPAMFDIGCWSVTLVFGEVFHSSDIKLFIPLLEGLGVSYFISSIDGNISIDIQ